MPIMNIHLKEDCFNDEQITELLEKSSQHYCEVLECPIDRVRVFINTYPGNRMSVKGKVCTDPDDKGAPYFEFIVLEGRSVDQIQQLIEKFTGLIASVLQVEQNLVRGACWPVHPAHWGIGGVPASLTRAREIAARKNN